VLSDREISRTAQAFRTPQSCRQVAEKLGISKQAVALRVETMRAAGFKFGITRKRISSKGPDAKLLFVTFAP
jgi:biotin operon repressor